MRDFEMTREEKKELDNMASIDQLVELIGVVMTNQEDGDEKERMAKFANDIYRKHFADKEPFCRFLEFIGCLMFEASSNLVGEKK